MQRHTKVIVAVFIAILLYGSIKYLPSAFEHMRGAAGQHQMALMKV